LPLFEKARIEVYVPDLPIESYQDLIESYEQEFTYTFGGCSILRGIDGSYQSSQGFHVRDRIAIVYADIGISFDSNLDQLSRYADQVRNAAAEALEEETVLVVVMKVFHSE
jgi:hypothetical protein